MSDARSCSIYASAVFYKGQQHRVLIADPAVPEECVIKEKPYYRSGGIVDHNIGESADN